MSTIHKKVPAQAAGLATRLERKDESGGGGGSDIDELKSRVDEFMNGWSEFKEANDRQMTEIKNGIKDPLGEEKLTKINSFLDGFEDLNQKTTQATKKAEELDELKTRFDFIETSLKRLGKGSTEEEKADRAGIWARAVVDAHTVGVPNLSEDQRKCLEDVAGEYKALNVGSDTAGGYLAPSEYVREMIKDIVETSPVRALARVRNTSMKEMELPKRTGTGSASRTHEQGTKTGTGDPAYGLETITCPEMFALIDVTNQMLEDSAFDIAAEIREDASEQFAVLEGSEFVSGSGVGEMQGILTHADISENNSGSATTIADANGQANGLLTMKYGLKSFYARNASWILNRTVMGSVRKLKDGNNNYIWMPGLANGQPNTIDGDPYVEVPDMPNEGAGNYPVAYGDFRRGYTMVDRIAMEMLRDPFTQATGGKVRFIFRRRGGGKVTLASAIRKMKCAA